MFRNHDRASAQPLPVPVPSGEAHPRGMLARLQRRFLLREHARYLVALLARHGGSPRAALEAELWRVHRALTRH